MTILNYRRDPYVKCYALLDKPNIDSSSHANIMLFLILWDSKDALGS